MHNELGDSTNDAAATMASHYFFEPYDLLCFSHLRWHFVTQRPQHLLSRCAKNHRVFFWEEPFFDGEDDGWVEAIEESHNLCILRPHLSPSGDRVAAERRLLDALLRERKIVHFVRWYYTPMALAFSAHLRAEVTVYDCMDELSGFLGAPRELGERERELFAVADLVFTGGISLFEAKKKQHAQVHAFPSSIDVAHFGSVDGTLTEPEDQQSIPRPRAGFYGVLDERFDVEMMAEVVRSRPEMQFILLGPVVKIDPATLPQGPNVHYLGAKSYAELPRYLAGWDIATMPFAMNDSTRYISPTKTPEYLAAGKPVVSTPIRDVVRGYGDEGLVAIAADAKQFATALDSALQTPTEEWKRAVSAKLAQGSWDRTWEQMSDLIAKARVASMAAREFSATAGSYRLGDRTPISLGRERFDYLVVGAGFAGSVLAERLANDMGKLVLIIDKRKHVAGNAYDYRDAAGLMVHRYGPHIFHTNSDEVVRYLSRFTEWHAYEHRVLASVDGMLLPIPINLDTINQLYGLSLDGPGMQSFLSQRTEVPASIRTSEDICVSRVGRELYEKFFRNYTRKQWGLDPSELDASVAGRIPVRFDRDDRYFSDTFQAMPKHGYTRMFERMLDHPKITIRTGVNYAEVVKAYPGVKTIFTGPVDEFFDYRFGPLPYRSLEFKHETFNMERFQPAAVVNYPNDHAYTRVTEFKYLTGETGPKTSVVFEYPREEGDPYYPIPRPENAAIYAKYKELADKMKDVHFVGRLANYKYYNMDQVVAQALTLYKKLAGKKIVPFLPGGTADSLLAEAR